jgi:hypothetical protein
MRPPEKDSPNPDAALLIASGVNLPSEHVAKIAQMYQAAASGRDAIRALRLGETEPATTFAPQPTNEVASDE